MENREKVRSRNRLGELPIPKLLRQFAIPSVIAMLVSALYNIVDQFFIGRSIGELGNAATNIAFPLSISCIAIALLCGIGGASAFNLAMGEGNAEDAAYYGGNSLSLMVGAGIMLAVVVQLFLNPLLVFFGSPAEVLGYASTYTRITSIGFPFLILTAGGGHLVRADGAPSFSMLCNMVGAVVNTILDAWFVFGLHWGMAGAAAATIIGQILSAMMVIHYIMHFRTVQLMPGHFILQKKYANRVIALGGAPCSNQLAMMVVQIIMNNSLKYYGARSVYGEAIPLACVGIITKVNQLFFSFIIGISQGLQPLLSFNYGAKKFDRVKEAYLLAAKVGFGLAMTAFLLFQIFPRQIIGLFGHGSEAYYSFAIQYFRVFLFFTFLNFMQPITSNFFTSTGRPQRGMFLSLTRQIIFLLPLLVLFPLLMGIDGIMFAGPVADFMAGTVAIFMMWRELAQERYRA